MIAFNLVLIDALVASSHIFACENLEKGNYRGRKKRKEGKSE